MNIHEMLPKTELNCPDGLEVVVLGGGCFWCTEAVFLRLNGVIQVNSGYAGGLVERPSYQQICSGTTGHAEVIQVIFDPTKINLSELLAVFWATHDPTTLNRQGGDTGPQYRSAIFYLSDTQEKLASEMMEKLNQSKEFSDPIVTEITAFSNFYPAEKYHQNYYMRNEGQPYCQYVVRPKVEKLQRLFEDKLKP